MLAWEGFGIVAGVLVWGYRVIATIGKKMNDDSYIVIKFMHDSLKVFWTSSLNDKSCLLFQFLVFISDCKQFM